MTTDTEHSMGIITSVFILFISTDYAIIKTTTTKEKLLLSISMQCVRRVQINIVVATPPEVRLAPCNLGPPSNSREQPGVIPGSCPWEKSPLSTMDQYLYSRLHASIYLD